MVLMSPQLYYIQPALYLPTRKQPQLMCEHTYPRSLTRCCSKKRQQAPQLLLSFCIKTENYRAPQPNPLLGFPKPGPEHSLCRIPRTLIQIPYPAHLAVGTQVKNVFFLCVCLRGALHPSVHPLDTRFILVAPTLHSWIPVGSQSG